jgi:hypothetical protein
MRAVPLGLRDGDRERMSALTRASTVPAGMALRARIVLLAADGVSRTEIAERVGVSRPTVIGWRARYEQAGLDGLEERPRPGLPSGDRSPEGNRGDAAPAAGQAQSHALVDPAVDRTVEDRPCHCHAGVEGLRGRAVAV